MLTKKDKWFIRRVFLLVIMFDIWIVVWLFREEWDFNKFGVIFLIAYTAVTNLAFYQASCFIVCKIKKKRSKDDRLGKF